MRDKCIINMLLTSNNLPILACPLTCLLTNLLNDWPSDQTLNGPTDWLACWLAYSLPHSLLDGIFTIMMTVFKIRKRLLIIVTEQHINTWLFYIFRELIEKAPCESTAHTLYKVAHNLCEKLAEGDSMVTDKNKNVYDVTHTIHHLLCQASTHCSPGMLTPQERLKDRPVFRQWPFIYSI